MWPAAERSTRSTTRFGTSVPFVVGGGGGCYCLDADDYCGFPADRLPAWGVGGIIQGPGLDGDVLAGIVVVCGYFGDTDVV